MPFEIRDDDQFVDPTVGCSTCSALCCRLTVILEPGDVVPPLSTVTSATGVEMMKRAVDGWCVAIDRASMRCTIYETRPAACARFTMGAGFCRALREDFTEHRSIAHTLVD